MGIKLITSSDVTEKDAEIELRIVRVDRGLEVQAFRDGELMHRGHVLVFNVVGGKIRATLHNSLNPEYFHTTRGGFLEL